MIKKRKNNPVNDIELTYHIILSKGTGELTTKAQKYIVILVENAMNKIRRKFNDEDDIDDATQTAYLNILTKWQMFNPDIAPSAFAYFTQTMKNASAEFANTWNKMRGINKEDQKTMRRMSINGSNDGQGMFNLQ